MNPWGRKRGHREAARIRIGVVRTWNAWDRTWEGGRSVLYRALREHLESFLVHAEEGCDRRLPRFVQCELRRYLDCGILAYGHCVTRLDYLCSGRQDSVIRQEMGARARDECREP